MENDKRSKDSVRVRQRKAFGQWLKQQRTNLGKSQAEIAKAARMEGASWSRLENGNYGLTQDRIPDIARALNVSAEVVARMAGYASAEMRTDAENEIQDVIGMERVVLDSLCAFVPALDSLRTIPDPAVTYYDSIQWNLAAAVAVVGGSADEYLVERALKAIVHRGFAAYHEDYDYPQYEVVAKERYTLTPNGLCHIVNHLPVIDIRSAVYERHRAYFLDFLGGAVKDGGDVERARLNRCVTETPQLNIALERLLNWQNWDIKSGEAALDFVIALQPLWRLRSSYAEGLRIAENVLRHPGAQNLTGKRGRALLCAAEMAWEMNKYDKATDHIENALHIANLTNDKALRALCRWRQGMCYNDEGEQVESALACYKEAQQIWKALRKNALKRDEITEAEYGLTNVHLSIGILVESNPEQLAFAEEELEAGLKGAEKLQDSVLQSLALNNLAYVAEKQNNLPLALKYAIKGLDIRNRLGKPNSIAYSLEKLAPIVSKLGDDELATVLVGHASYIRAEHKAPKPPSEMQEYNKFLHGLRQRLGSSDYTHKHRDGAGIQLGELIETVKRKQKMAVAHSFPVLVPSL